jgi:hypothetical protein
MEPAVVVLLSALPELRHDFEMLARAADGDPGGAALFGELAETVADLAHDVDDHLRDLARYLAAVERVARTCVDAEELVGWAFLDSLSPQEIRILEPLLGAWTKSIVRHMEQG